MSQDLSCAAWTAKLVSPQGGFCRYFDANQKSEIVLDQVAFAKVAAEESRSSAAAAMEAATSKLSAEVQQLQAAVAAAEARAAAAEQEAAQLKASAAAGTEELGAARAETAAHRKEAQGLVAEVEQLKKQAEVRVSALLLALPAVNVLCQNAMTMLIAYISDLQ